ncbi:VRR-NUC domain-containing protein [Marinobacterium sp. D7]|uniref:VRR-NUC domain-containing protein n=1 Tax=Marinobacterium ramblicola TaxID=2849041 RepID=UPI001C2DCB56|nr:VRR-NUC domain-containing protein [Marinobacterium ramblicola]MBV1790661.1 VRR-NUC domain-containing protein [Marinobacterium ramblicola]
MPNTDHRSTLDTADLSDPLYYLHNFRTLVQWVGRHHMDLLLEPEREQIDQLLALPTPSLALLVRMLMRRGEQFRASRLVYDEIGSTINALPPLINQGWIEFDPAVDSTTLCRLLTREELVQTLDSDVAQFPASLSKSAITEHLQTEYGEHARRLKEWAPTLDDQLLQLSCSDLFTRLQLMFFGNLAQDLSAFVLTELGYHRFEPVAFSNDSRAFACREEVDTYLSLHAARESLEHELPLGEIVEQLPPEPLDNAWLERRRSRLLFELGRRAERAGDYELALDLYQRSRHTEAGQRAFRVLELSRPNADSYAALIEAITQSVRPSEREALSRIERRMSRTLGREPKTRLKRPTLPRLDLSLPCSGSVETSVAQHLGRQDAPVFFVENTLINGLFALLCWPALYAPLPGAFFNPFQAAPADLNSHDFVTRRQSLFDDALSCLATGEYRERILGRWRDKAGTTCPFINWQLLGEEQITLALECIPANHLKDFFQRLLEDIPAHRSGLPDLIQFFPQGIDGVSGPSYRLIEVKGPGDRLQDHQRSWLEFCLEQGVEVSVCYVRWEQQTID